MDLFNTSSGRKARRGAVLAVLSSALIFPAMAAAKPLAFTHNEGLEPIARFGRPSLKLKQPQELSVTVTGSQQAEMEGSFTVACFGDGARRQTREYTVLGPSPATQVVAIEERWNYCRVKRATASYVNELLSGWVSIKASGTERDRTAATAGAGPRAAKATRLCANAYGGDVVFARRMSCRRARRVVRAWGTAYKADGVIDREALGFTCRGSTSPAEGLTITCRLARKRVSFYANVP